MPRDGLVNTANTDSTTRHDQNLNKLIANIATPQDSRKNQRISIRLQDKLNETSVTSLSDKQMSLQVRTQKKLVNINADRPSRQGKQYATLDEQI